MKSKIVSVLRKSGLEFPQSRRKVSVQEQLSTLRQAIAASNRKPHVPQSRSEVAAQEQVRVVQQGPIMSLHTYTSKQEGWKNDV